MCSITYGSRCLVDQCGVYVFAGEVISDEPLRFRNFIAVNTNSSSVTVKIGDCSCGISGGSTMRYKLSDVGVKSEVNVRVRHATADFTGDTPLQFEVGIAGGNLSYTLLE